MLAFKLAYRNLVGAGLRTWLNVFVLSFAYVLIVWHQGLFFGMLEQASNETIKDEIGGGQYWHALYDPYDPISLDDAHGTPPGEIEALVQKNEAAKILISQASIFPKGRIQSVLIKGIDPNQTVLGIPTASLTPQDDVLPVIIGERMAKNNSFKAGDYITIRWRDVHGTFDALEAKITAVMSTNVPTVDAGQLWVPLDRLQKMMRLESQATIVVVNPKTSPTPDYTNWKFKSQDYLLSDIKEVVKTKRISSGILYVTLLFLALLAVFDTQILSIWRRRKEIGTLMALGMTRAKVIFLFTVEGMMYGILAFIMGAVYGIPLLALTAIRGIPIPHSAEGYGFAIPSKIMPIYPAALVIGTVLIIMITVTIVSYLPTREISKLKPTEALKGKIS